MLDKLTQGSALYQHELVELCKPLYSTFTIKQFMAYYVCRNSIIILNSNLAHLEHYLKAKQYQYDPHITHPDQMRSGTVLWNEYNDLYFQGSWLYDLRTRFEVGNGFSVVKQSEEGYSIHAFSSWHMNQEIYNDCFNYNKLFLGFIKYLSARTAELVQALQSYAVELTALKTPQQLTQPGITQHCLTSQHFNELNHLFNAQRAFL